MKVYIGPYIKAEEEGEREIEVEIHDYDLWSLDHTLAKIIYPALVKFREKPYGYPDVEDGDTPADETLFTKYNHELRRLWMPWDPDWLTEEELETRKDDMARYNRWVYVLDQMIFSFHCLTTDNQWEDEFAERNATHEEYMEMEDRISNGFRLFGKYYRSLWN